MEGPSGQFYSARHGQGYRPAGVPEVLAGEFDGHAHPTAVPWRDLVARQHHCHRDRRAGGMGMAEVDFNAS
jgi:hypothetical protein